MGNHFLRSVTRHGGRRTRRNATYSGTMAVVVDAQPELVSRSRVRTQTAWARLATYAIEPAGFLMTRRMLLGLKHRAEALRAASPSELARILGRRDTRAPSGRSRKNSLGPLKIPPHRG